MDLLLLKLMTSNILQRVFKDIVPLQIPMIACYIGSLIQKMEDEAILEDKITKDEKKLLIELICNEQTHMIIKDHNKYESEKYKKLEELKVKIKDM